jgi:hypothetical protein
MDSGTSTEIAMNTANDFAKAQKNNEGAGKVGRILK